MRRTFWRISARESDILSLTGHSLSAGKASRGKGISEAVFHLAEELCRSRGVRSMRADTDEKNGIRQHILEKNGFCLCGTIWFAGGDKLAYEKVL